MTKSVARRGIAEMKGCKQLFIAGDVPPAQYIYNLASQNSYKLRFHFNRPSDNTFTLAS